MSLRYRGETTAMPVSGPWVCDRRFGAMQWWRLGASPPAGVARDSEPLAEHRRRTLRGANSISMLSACVRPRSTVVTTLDGRWIRATRGSKYRPNPQPPRPASPALGMSDTDRDERVRRSSTLAQADPPQRQEGAAQSGEPSPPSGQSPDVGGRAVRSPPCSPVFGTPRARSADLDPSRSAYGLARRPWARRPSAPHRRHCAGLRGSRAATCASSTMRPRRVLMGVPDEIRLELDES